MKQYNHFLNYKNCPRSTIEVRPNALSPLNCGLDIQSQVSYCHDPHT